MITLTQIQMRIAEAIRTSGMTQNAIAEKVGVKRPQISCYLYGSKLPALDTLANLCAVLELDANDILCLNEYTAPKQKTVTVSNSFNNNSGKIDFKA